MLQILKKNRMPRLFLAVALAAAVALSGCGKNDAGKKDDTVVATYTGGTITKTELDQFASIFFSQYGPVGDNVEIQEYLLKQLATLKLLADKASEEVKKEAKTEAEGQVKQMEDYYNTQEKGAFDKQLKELNVTKKDLQSFVTLSTTVLKDTNNKISDDQLKQSYDAKLKEDAHVFDVASVAHILVALKDPADPTGAKDLRTKEEAFVRVQEVKERLNAGGDFAAVAKEYSDDPGSKETGGVYANENLATTMWDPDFRQAAIDQAVGQIGQPFESSFGYHIMRVDKRETQAFDAVKETLRSELADKAIGDFIDQELPKLEFKTSLPAPSASPDAAASAPAAASPSASAAASASPAAK
ncbi:MAG: PpiC-type peptidyl-prolyl cis-trans isomerase [Paenibacillaceae bacterium]|jgi:foldase protein PrsA|nr:PpiC-type peptidyl-prolyl cis-trans isomerase [Paenibacillaceae bacterium]